MVSSRGGTAVAGAGGQSRRATRARSRQPPARRLQTKLFEGLDEDRLGGEVDVVEVDQVPGEPLGERERHGALSAGLGPGGDLDPVGLEDPTDQLTLAAQPDAVGRHSEGLLEDLGDGAGPIALRQRPERLRPTIVSKKLAELHVGLYDSRDPRQLSTPQ